VKKTRVDNVAFMKKCNGFSLVELVFTIAIFAIILAIAIPPFRELLDRLTYRTAGRDITALIRAAKGFAIETNRQQRVVLDVANRSYRLQEGTRAISTPDAGWTTSTRFANTTTLSPGIGIQSSGVNNTTQEYTLITLNPDGSMSFTNAANQTDVAMRIDIMDTRVTPAVRRYRVDLTQTGKITGSPQ